MSGRIPWLKIGVITGGIMTLGYVTMIAVTPTPEQLYAKMSPEVRKRVDASRAQRIAGERALEEQRSTRHADPDEEKPVWADSTGKR